MLKKAIDFACWGNMPQSVRRVARLVMDINPSWKPPGPFSSTVYRPGSRTTLPRGQPEVWLSCAKRALAARLPMQGVPTSTRGCIPISGGGWNSYRFPKELFLREFPNFLNIHVQELP